MRGLGIVLACLVGMPAGRMAAAEPARVKPPWQRLLQGEDARKAKELEKRVGALQEAGKFEEALPLAQELAELRGRVQGTDHWQAIDARQTVEGLRRVLRLDQQSRATYKASFALDRQADALANKGQQREALPLREKVLAARRQALGEDHPDTAQAYNDLAITLNALGRYPQADEGYRKALDIRQKALGEDHPESAKSYNNVAFNQQAQAQHPRAEKGFRMALAIFRRVVGEEHVLTAQAYHNVAMSMEFQGRSTEAEEFCRQSLSILRKVRGEEHPDTAASYVGVAYNLNAQGRYKEAEKNYAKALAIRRKALGDEHPVTVQSYNHLANNFYRQGRYEEAAGLHRLALNIRRKMLGEYHPLVAQSCNNLANCLNAQGRYREAEEGLRKALDIDRKALGDEHPDTAIGYNNLAQTLYLQGRYAEAEEGLRKALDIDRKVLGEQHPSTARSYASLAKNLNQQGRYQEAQDFHHKALAIRRAVRGEQHVDTAQTYNDLAYSLERAGHLVEAEANYTKALDIFRQAVGERHPDTATTRNNLAVNWYSQGRYREAEEVLREVLEIRRQAFGEEHPETASCYDNLARALHAQGRYAEAETYLRRGADAFLASRLRIAASGLGRAARTSERSPLFALAAVLARNGKPAEAWQRLEQGLGRGAWDDLSARLRRSTAETDRQAELATRLEGIDRLLAQQLALSNPTAEQQRKRDELLERRLQTQETLTQFSQELERKYGPAAGQVFELAQVQAALPADTALLAWIDLPATGPKAADRNGERWGVLLRSEGQPVWQRLRGSGPEGTWTEDDTSLPIRLREALQSPQGDWRSLAAKLRDQRLGPLGKHLEGARHLVVLPSASLAGVPVEVIADDYRISYALSGTLYAHLKRQPAPHSSGLLAVGDPVFEAGSVTGKPPVLLALRRGDDDWRPLPGTRLEIEALRRLFGEQARVRVLLGSGASEQQLYTLAKAGELGRYRYVHLATHGEVDDAVGLRSAIILARDLLPDAQQQLQAGLPVYDGRLTADKMLRQWQLDAELVTLSACQSALGKYEKGEGFVGFVHALLLCGSRSVCLSLWKVDDTATALLMSRLYQNLLGKRDGLSAPLPRAEALAEAKSWLRQLSREQALKEADQLDSERVRGKDRPKLPTLPSTASAGSVEDRPYAHPFYWAAFVLFGDPQ
jgi:tetratricopeptide (TPR) repeat protein